MKPDIDPTFLPGVLDLLRRSGVDFSESHLGVSFLAQIYVGDGLISRIDNLKVMRKDARLEIPFDVDRIRCILRASTRPSVSLLVAEISPSGGQNREDGRMKNKFHSPWLY